MEGLNITQSSFSEAMALQRAVASAINKTKIQLNADIIDGAEIDADSLDSIIKMILNVGISKEIEDCLFVCSERVTYKNEKVNRDFFEKIENRALYYPIMFEVAKENLSPFFANLGSVLSDITKNLPGNRKQK